MTSMLADATLRLLKFRNAYLLLVSTGLTFFIPNFQIIGATEQGVWLYFGIFVLSYIAAERAGVGWEKINWYPVDPITEKPVRKDDAAFYAIVTGVMVAAATFGLMAFMSASQSNYPQPFEGDAAQMILYQLLLVSLVETVVFVGLIPNVLEKYLVGMEPARRTALVYVLSVAAFGSMHWRAYGGDIPQMFAIGMMGGIWLWLGRKYGLSAPWWSHLIYNLWQIGMFMPGVV
jgi:hypothetical protein